MWATQLGGDCLYRIGQPAIILAPWTGLHANVLLVSHGLYSPVSQVPRIMQLVPRVLIGCPAVAWVSTYAMDRRSIHCRCDQSQSKYITDFGHPVVSAESYQISLSTSKLHPLSVFSSCNTQQRRSCGQDTCIFSSLHKTKGAQTPKYIGLLVDQSMKVTVFRSLQSDFHANRHTINLNTNWNRCWC